MHVLIVEDEHKIAQLLVDYLQASQYETSHIDNGLDVVPYVKNNKLDLILLDLMLPGKDGLEICREIRQFSDIPIIMITARIEEIDRILGLEIGADDYICKPFSPREVVARVKVIFRRLEILAKLQGEKEFMQFASSSSGLVLDSDSYMASYQGNKLELTPVEFRLLQSLMNHPGKVFSRDVLMSDLYTDNRIVTDRTVDSHIKNLRKKLHKAGASDELIHSVYGVGYKFEFAS